MYIIDLHLHTRRYSECAELMDPEAMVEAALEKGLSGVVITEHDQQWSAGEVEELEMMTGGTLKIYRGVEVTCVEGHFVVIGLDHSPAYKGISVAELHKLRQRTHCAVIWAHPGRDHKLPATIKGMRKLLSQVSAVEESAYTVVEPLKSLIRSKGIPVIGGSDAHYPGRVGTVSTRFPILPENELQLAMAIQMGLGSALSPNAPDSPREAT